MRWLRNPVVGVVLTLIGAAGVVGFVVDPVGGSAPLLGGLGVLLLTGGLVGVGEWRRSRRFRSRPGRHRHAEPESPDSLAFLGAPPGGPSGAVGSGRYYHPESGRTTDGTGSSSDGGAGGSGGDGWSGGGGGFSGDSGGSGGGG